MAMTFNSRTRWPIAAIVVLVVLSAFWIGFTGTQAELSYSATCTICLAVEKYITVNKQWPRSWNELKTVQIELGGGYSWPRDSVEIQKYVDVDFNTTLKELTRYDTDNFVAIKPKAPAYGGYKTNISRLLNTIRIIEDQQEEHDSIPLPKPSPTDSKEKETPSNSDQ